MKATHRYSFDGVYRPGSGARDGDLVSMRSLKCWETAKSRSFYARDNVCNFIKWCRFLAVREAVIFESEDLVLHNGQRNVVLCLLEVARIACTKHSFSPTPGLVQLEQEIDQQIQKEEVDELNGGVDRVCPVSPVSCDSGLGAPGREKGRCRATGAGTGQQAAAAVDGGCWSPPGGLSSPRRSSSAASFVSNSSMASSVPSSGDASFLAGSVGANNKASSNNSTSLISQLDRKVRYCCYNGFWGEEQQSGVQWCDSRLASIERHLVWSVGRLGRI